jgi:hypothetical protein
MARNEIRFNGCRRLSMIAVSLTNNKRKQFKLSPNLTTLTNLPIPYGSALTDEALPEQLITY